MTESCIEQIDFQTPRLNHFIMELQKRGNIMTLNELYAHDQKQCNEIILGVVYHVSNVIKKSDRQLLVLYLREVTVNCHKGKFFSLYAFNEFAISLADACLQKGDFIAFRSAYVEENTRYRIEKDCHDLQARIGIPPRTGTKVFFLRKSQITNCDSSQNLSATSMSPVVCLKRLPSRCTLNREPATSNLNRNPSPSHTETLCHSTRISPVSCISNRFSPNHETSTVVSSAPHNAPACSNHNASSRISPSTSIARVREIPSTSGGIRVALQNTQTAYAYKRISELVEPEKKVNIYGVISSITKMPTTSNKHAIVRLRDETCGSTMEFRVHIFFKHEDVVPKLEHGYILRLHRMKTELYEDVLDGRVFRASDIVTFPPEGEGIANSFTTAGSFHFSDSDARRLTELRSWIASRNQQPPAPAHPTTVSLPAAVPPKASGSVVPQRTVTTQRLQTVSLPPCTENVADCQSAMSSEPTETLLSEVKKEGNYVLLCKVLKVDVLSKEMLILTVTDGTLFSYSLHLSKNIESQAERYITREVRIIILEPSVELKKIKKGALVKLINVKVYVALVPFSQFEGPILSLKMIGNDCSVKIFKGIEREAVKLKRQLQDLRMQQQQHPDNPDDLLTAEPVTVTQQPGGCASSSSSDSDIFLTNVKYDTKKYCGKELKSRGSNRTEESERCVSRTVTNTPQKRSLPHEAESERGHKLQKLTSGALDSHKTVDVDGSKSNDKVSSQIEAITSNSDHDELVVSGKQACSDRVSESTEIQRHEISKQISSNSNNPEETSSRSVSHKEVGKLDTLVGAQESKSVSPPPVREPKTSEHPVHTEVHNTSISSLSSTSSKDQYKSAISSPILQHCKQMHVSGLVPGKEHAFTITSSKTEEYSRHKTSVHQAEDVVKSPHQLQHNGVSGMPVAPQKLQRSITFPLSPPSKNTTICSKRHLSVWLDDLGKTVADRHCTSQRARDVLGHCSSRQGVNQTSCNPDSSLICYRFQSSDDTMDHAMRNLSKAVMHNDLSMELTNAVPSRIVLDVPRRITVDDVSHHSPDISPITLSAQNEDIDEEVASSKDKSSVNEFLDVRNKPVLKILPVEDTGRNESGGSVVAQHLIHECNPLNSEDHSQVAENPAPPSVEDDPQQLDLITGFFTYNSHPVQQNLLSDRQSKLQVEDERHLPSLNNGPRLTETEQCLPASMSVTEKEELHCREPHKTLVEENIANTQLDPVLEQNSVFTGSMKEKGQDTEHPVASEQSMLQDLLAENTPYEDNDHQVNEDETYAQFSDAVTARNIVQHCTSTQSSNNQNKKPILSAGCSEDDGGSVTSEEVPASEVDHLDSADKFSALTAASLTDSELSNKHVAETLVFVDYSSSDVLSASRDCNASLCRTVQTCPVPEKNKSMLKVNDECKEQDDRSCSASVGNCVNEDKHKELSSLELCDGTVECRVTFASGITAVPGMVQANISYIKRKKTREKEVYLLNAWVKDIEPPFNNSSKMNIVIGFCSYCNHMQSYEALMERSGTDDRMCQFCFQEGKKMPVELGFLLRLYLIDENNDELIATVSAQHGAELLGCTADAYLNDDMTRRRVTQMLTKLIEKNKKGPLLNRGPMLKLLIVPIHTSVGREYLVHNTYLFGC